MKKYILLLFVIIAFINYSCYSYDEISQDEVQKKAPGDIVKIEMKDRSALQVIVKDISIKDSTVTLTQKLTTTTIKLSNIEKFYGEKFSLVATLLVVPVTVLGVLAVFFLFYNMTHFSGFTM